MMELDIEGIIGFVSLLGGFFLTLYKMLGLTTDAQKRLLAMLEQLNSFVRGKNDRNLPV